MHITKTLCLAAGITLLLGGCGIFQPTDRVPEPVGIGYETDDLKRSPCACVEIPQNWHGYDIRPANNQLG